MSAPMMLGASDQQASLRANLPKQKKEKQTKKRPTEKHILNTPYTDVWPDIVTDTEIIILQKLKEILLKFDLNKKTDGGKQKDSLDSEMKERKRKLRSQMVFGVNSVTKELEKDQLQLVIVCKSADPAILTRHLIGLCVTRNCTGACVTGLNKVLSDTINMGSIAVGFKKSTDDTDVKCDDFSEFIAYVQSEVPTITCKGFNQCVQNDHIPQSKTCSEMDGNDNSSNQSESKNTSSNKSESTNSSSSVTKIDNEKSLENSSKTDYSRFYVFKKDEEDSVTSNSNGFIPIISCENFSTDYQSKKSKKRKSEHNKQASGYISLDVKKMKGNEKKKKKVKISNK